MKRCLLGLALVAGPLVAQDRTYPQSGTAHAATKAVYSWAAYASLRELGTSRPVAAAVATVGLWGAGYVIERGKGHQQQAIDKVHDLAAHALVVIPLASWRRPQVLVPSLVALGLTLALTCGRANPRSC